MRKAGPEQWNLSNKKACQANSSAGHVMKWSNVLREQKVQLLSKKLPKYAETQQTTDFGQKSDVLAPKFGVWS